MTCLFLCVNFNNDEESLTFAESIVNQPDFHGRVYIISCSKIETDSQLNNIADNRIKVIDTKENLGYFKAAAAGLNEYLKHKSIPDWIIVSNTDIKLGDNFLFKILDKINNSSAPAILAPDIQLIQKSWTASTLTSQNPAMLKRPTRRKLTLLACICRWKITYMAYEFFAEIKLGLINRLFQRKKETISSPRDIYAAFGACIIFHKTYFDRGGDLAFGSFLYYEEIYVAEKARQLGLRTHFEPRLRLLHNEHSTTKMMGAARRQKNAYDSLTYIINEFFKK
jgi:GT2 family glycosyltransferase